MSIHDTLRSAILRANETGSAVAVIEGRHKLSWGISISTHEETALPKLGGVLTVDARAAEIVIDTPTGLGIEIEGSARHTRSRIIWDGGKFFDGRVGFRCLDLLSSTIQPHSFEGCETCIESGVFRSWSENNWLGGAPGRPCYFRRCKRGIELYGREQFWERLGAKPDDPETRQLKYESFAGTTISDIVIAGATDPTLDGQVVYADHAAVYRSSIDRIRGNTPNGGGSLIWSNNQYWRATTIRGIAVEKANERDKPRSAAIRFAKRLTAHPDVIERPWWMGGMASGIQYASVMDRFPLPQSNRDHEFASATCR